jgi:hypothetical protein
MSITSFGRSILLVNPFIYVPKIHTQIPTQLNPAPTFTKKNTQYKKGKLCSSIEQHLQVLPQLRQLLSKTILAAADSLE